MSPLRNVLLLNKRFYQFSFKKNVRYLSTATKQDVNIICSNLPDIEIPKITIPELIFSKCQQYAKYTATECTITGRKYTYDEIIQKSRNFGKSLRKKLKLQRGDVVAIFLPNLPEYPIATLGILDGGLILTTLNPIYTSDEVSKQLLDSGAKAIITIPELFEHTKTAIGLMKKDIPVLLVKTKANESLPSGSISFDEFANATNDIPDIEPGSIHDVVVLPYSSGTTGLPKGVELTHYSIVSNIYQINHPDYILTVPATDSHQDNIPVVLPLFHIYGFVCCGLSMFLSGAKSLTMPRFAPDEYISVLQKNDVHLILAAPPLVLFLAAHPGVKPEYFKNCRNVMSGAAPLGALDEERFLEKAKNVTIVQGYGLTEASPVVTTTPPHIKKLFKPNGTIGKPLVNTEIKIISIDDKSGTPLGPNQQGELLVKGPQLMKGYHNKPEATKETFLDGWLRTGDLAYYDENNLFYLTERLKELIKVKGFQVAPAELEEIIRDFPNVSDAAVVGIPHPIDGEVPRAYVVPKNPKDFKSEELDRHVTQKVAKYKQLRGGIEVVEAIPKNASGKILRRKLREEYKEKNL